MSCYCAVNVRLKSHLSIENFIFLKIVGCNRILFGWLIVETQDFASLLREIPKILRLYNLIFFKISAPFIRPNQYVENIIFRDAVARAC